MYRRADEDAHREREREKADVEDAHVAIDEAIRISQAQREADARRTRSRAWLPPLVGAIAGGGLCFAFTTQLGMIALGAVLGLGGVGITRLIDRIPPNPNPPSRSDLG